MTIGAAVGRDRRAVDRVVVDLVRGGLGHDRAPLGRRGSTGPYSRSGAGACRRCSTASASSVAGLRRRTDRRAPAPGTAGASPIASVTVEQLLREQDAAEEARVGVLGVGRRPRGRAGSRAVVDELGGLGCAWHLPGGDVEEPARIARAPRRWSGSSSIASSYCCERAGEVAVAPRGSVRARAGRPSRRGSLPPRPRAASRRAAVAATSFGLLLPDDVSPGRRAPSAAASATAATHRERDDRAADDAAARRHGIGGGDGPGVDAVAQRADGRGGAGGVVVVQLGVRLVVDVAGGALGLEVVERAAAGSRARCFELAPRPSGVVASRRSRSACGARSTSASSASVACSAARGASGAARARARRRRARARRPGGPRRACRGRRPPASAGSTRRTGRSYAWRISASLCPAVDARRGCRPGSRARSRCELSATDRPSQSGQRNSAASDRPRSASDGSPPSGQATIASATDDDRRERDPRTRRRRVHGCPRAAASIVSRSVDARRARTACRRSRRRA